MHLAKPCLSDVAVRSAELAGDGHGHAGDIQGTSISVTIEGAVVEGQGVFSIFIVCREPSATNASWVESALRKIDSAWGKDLEKIINVRLPAGHCN